MVSCYRFLTAISLFFISGLISAQTNDPGLPDTLRIESRPVHLSQSTPLTVSIFNDSTILNFNFVLAISTQDSGFMRFDSAKFVGRMADPSVLPFRIVNTRWLNGSSPDTLLIACLRNAEDHFLPGDGPVVELFFTGLKLGSVLVDSTSVTSGVSIDFLATGPREYHPMFSPVEIEVTPADLPPVLTLPESVPIVATCQDQVNFQVQATSPGGHPVELQLGSFVSLDDDVISPNSKPHFARAGPGDFTWNPSCDDVGIWSATFRAVDTTGVETTGQLEIQIVSGPEFLLAFQPGETEDTPQATGLAHGDINHDNSLELLIPANPTWYNKPFAAYQRSGALVWSEVFSLEEDYIARGICVAYLDDDPYVDAVIQHRTALKVLHGRDDNSFEVEENPAATHRLILGATLIDFDGDPFLDYVGVTTHAVVVYRGRAGAHFENALVFAPGDSALSINGADFNHDGYDDLAVGTRAGLEIYLNDTEGGFEFHEAHSQEFGAADIEVTNQGSDFNDDGIFDLCLATPSVGGEYSELMVYLGRGDGTFDRTPVRRVRGQIFASRAGDFNGDARLDIAYINGARDYLAIIFGDGRGEFRNELRYQIPKFDPRRMDCMDVDLDGDLDVLVAAYQLGIGLNSSLFEFENLLDPATVTSGTLEVRAANNADIELQAPGGGKLNRIVNSIASADLYLRDLDNNDNLDAVAVTRTVEMGRYDLIVRPKQNLPPGEPFSLEYQLDDRKYRIARDQPISELGHLFPIYAAGNSPISPRQGEFIQTALPTFTWESGGVERFELATDIGFTDILEQATVSGGVYTPQIVLPETDSATYFWRTIAETGAEFTPIQAFNVVRAPTDVEESDSPAELPDSCRLAQNYPNPFNPNTTVEYYLPDGAGVKITIHNVLGQHIRTLVDQFMPSGTHTVDWDATDLYDHPVASGIYFYRMEVGDFSSTRKMVLVR